MADAVEVTWRQVARWRLRRQLLVEPAADGLAAAGRVCGLHAQVASCTALIAGLRTAGRADLDTALWTDRTLVRIWAMRGTLHLMPAAELDAAEERARRYGELLDAATVRVAWT